MQAFADSHANAALTWSCCALSLVYDQKTGFSAAISPNVYRSGWNLARICCDME